MIEQLDNKWYQNEFLLFKDEGKLDIPKAKTRVWSVMNRSNGKILGFVKWYGQWRKYCFFPEYTMCFDTKCMQDIGSFCKDRTDDHKKKWKKRVPDGPPFEPLLVKKRNKSQTEGWIDVIKSIGKESNG